MSAATQPGLAPWLVALTVWTTACRFTPATFEAHATGCAHLQESAQDAVPARVRPDPERSTGILLRSLEGRDWGLRLRLPLSVGLTEFDLGSGTALANLSTVALVPTVELIVPLDESWTLLPFAGLGAAVQVGDRDLVGGDEALWLATGGLRARRWQPFAERYAFVLESDVRYDAALTRRNGLLGDWGSLAAAVELRRAFGAPRDGPRFEGGVYLQGIWFWDPVELEIAGVTPSFVDHQREIGISLGSTSPYKVLGITLPRVFIGVRVGDGLRSLRLRFGRL